MTVCGLWLAARELSVRRRSVALAAAVVATLAGASTVTELLSRAREEAVAIRIDGIGPALTVLPGGMTPGALSRYAFGPDVLAAGTSDAIAEALGSDLRRVEERLVRDTTIAGVRAAVVGLDPRALPEALSRGGADAVAVGSELARRIGSNSSVWLEGREYRVTAVLPSVGSAEDLAAFLPIASVWRLAGTSGVNELRVFLRAGVEPRDAERRLARALPDAAVIRTDRGEVADHATQASLQRHRAFAYAVMAAVAALCLLIAAHLDASERHIELATLVAIGASRWTVLGSLLGRSAIIAVVGACAGIVAGAVVAAGQDPSVAGALARGWSFAAAAVGVSLAIAVLAATPTALACTFRDPVAALQDGA